MLLYPVVITISCIVFRVETPPISWSSKYKECLEHVDSCQAIHKSTILTDVPEVFSDMGHVVADVFMSVSQSCKEAYGVLCPCKESYAVPMTL